MTTEYHIQKRGLQVWQYVTWYETYEEAKKNFDILAKRQGYSYRVVELKVLDEAKLEGERGDVAPGDEPYIPNENTVRIPADDWRKANMGVSSQQEQFKNSGWGQPTITKDHGMVGKVWLGNPTTKEKKRVESSLVESMMAEGWVKAGPRTVL